MAAQTDMMEAHLGQMAADQASSQNVKTYAQMLVTDHTADYQQLGTLAAKAGLTVPTGLDAAHNKMIAPFEKLKGAAFDSRYVQTLGPYRDCPGAKGVVCPKTFLPGQLR
jgi:putative membrane protein